MLVLDTDVATDVLLEDTDRARFYKEVIKSERVISTEMFQAELAHTLMKYLRAGQLDSSNVLQVFLTGIHLVQDYIPVSIDAHEAMIEGIRQNHSPYDMLYFVLARRTGATLLTHDKQLQKLCLRQSVAFAADIPFPDEE